VRIDVETWSRVTTLFDRLVDLDPETRAEELARTRLEADVADWLNRLLDAHDQPDELVIDRTLQGVVDGLAGIPGTADPDLFPGPGERLGPWRLVEELGRGGMGSVLRGERADGRYDQTVAVKLLRPSAYGGIDLDAMDNEIRLLARLEHPGIVRLIEGGITPDGLPYLVMEYVAGEPIDQWCDRRNSTLQTRMDLIRQVTAALAHAHRRLVIHADIKPSNVLVSDDGRVRLVDFGIAGRLQKRADARLPAMLRCSPAWCAPEQLKGAPPDVAQDVFGVGALALRLLTGDRIRTGDRITRLLAGASIEDEPPAPPSSRALAGLPVREIRGSLDAVCAGALAADPGARYPSIEALDAELERWQRHEPVRAARLGRTARFALWFRRNRVPAVAGALAGLAMIVGTAAAVWQADRARDAADHAQLQAERADTVRDFVLSLFRAADPLRVGGAELDTRTVLAQASRQLDDDKLLDRELRVEILNTLADVQMTLGWDEDAAELIDAAFKLQESGPVSRHLAAETLLQEGKLLESNGDFDAALERFQRGHALLHAVDDEPGRLVRARTLLQIGANLARTGQSRDANAALARAEQALAALEVPNPELGMLLASSRGVAAYTAGDYPTAQRYMQETVEIERRIGNAQHASMVTSLGNLAAVTAQLGDPEQALVYDREAVEIARAAYPQGHTTIGRALYAYGDSLRQLGRLDEADAALIESRSIQLTAGKPAEIELVDLTRARVLLAAGRHQETAALIEPARPALAARWGDASDVVLQALEVEIAARSALDQSEHVAAMRRTALDLLGSLEPDKQSRPVANLLRWRLAYLALREGRHSDARAMLRAAGTTLPSSTPPTLVLKLDALAIGLQIAAGSPADEANIKALQEALEPTVASADTRAYAWCTLAIAARATGDENLLRRALDSIATLRGERTLTAEGVGWLAEAMAN